MNSIDIAICCEDCGALIAACLHETVAADHAVWGLGYCCPNCEASIEMNGDCPAPDEWRSRMLEAHGTWQITLAGEPSVHELAVVRSLMRWTLAELTRFRDARDRLLAEGTKAEMEAAGMRLESKGLTPALTPALSLRKRGRG